MNLSENTRFEPSLYFQLLVISPVYFTVQNLVKERYTEIKEGGKAIHTMVKDTNKVLRVSNASNDWRSYVDFVNNVVVDGLAQVGPWS